MSTDIIDSIISSKQPPHRASAEVLEKQIAALSAPVSDALAATSINFPMTIEARHGDFFKG